MQPTIHKQRATAQECRVGARDKKVRKNCGRRIVGEGVWQSAGTSAAETSAASSTTALAQIRVSLEHAGIPLAERIDVVVGRCRS